MSGGESVVDALVLAGGRSSRMNGVDKTVAVVGGRTLVDRAVAAVSSCRAVVVVGPTTVPVSAADVVRAREDPPFGGPVRALAAGMSALHHRDPRAADVIVVLSADLPFVTDRVVTALVDALLARPEVDAVFGTDAQSRMQYLVGAWRTEALTGAVTALEPASTTTRQPAVRSILPANHVGIALTGIDDVDTADDLEAARTAGVRPTLARARALIADRVPPRAAVTGPLHEHLGGSLAAPLRAVHAFPRFPTSAMDGYAVVGDGPWRVAPTVVTAGAGDRVDLAPGTAVRIATGAPVPAGASVIRDEFLDVRLPILQRRTDSPIRNDARAIGEDWAEGAELAPTGTPITPAVISAALSAGVRDGVVRSPATVRIVISGNEIADADAPLRPGLIHDTIGPVMPNYLQWCGFRVADTVWCEDTDAAFDAALTEPGADGALADVVLIVGATGGGAADRLQEALIRQRTTALVSGLACRPGGSASVSTLGDGRVVFGVPGNPYAAVSTVCLLGPAIAHALLALTPPPRTTGRLADAVTPTAVARSLPATYLGEDLWTCETSVRTAHLAALVGRDGLAIIGPDVAPDGRVEIVPLPRR